MPDAMRFRRKIFADWHDHINAVQVDVMMADWLTNRDSLTMRLVARSSHFRVQKLRQGRSMCLADECEEIGLSFVQQVIEREVLLRCDEKPVVYAHTILPLSANASHWPLFASLGNRSLGTTLFSDPLVQRGQLHYARLWREHPLVRRIVAEKVLSPTISYLWARRSVFHRKGAPLLVTEVFLPEINGLPQLKGEHNMKKRQIR